MSLEPSPSVRSEPPRLTFDWRRRSIGPRFHLIGFLFLAVVGHGLFFYLFKVVTPGTSRISPPSKSVTLLPAGDPQVAALLRGISSKSPLAHRFDATGTNRAVAPRAPIYVATYQNHAPALLPLPPQNRETGARLFQPSIPLMPDLPAPPRKDPLAPVPVGESYIMEIGPKLAGTAQTKPPVWPVEEVTEAADETENQGSGSLALVIAVNSRGRIAHCMALRWDNLQSPEELRRAVAAVRFAPTGSAGLIWESVLVRW